MHELDPVKRRMHAGGLRWATMFAEKVLGEAQRVVPLAEGTLAASGHVTDPQINADGSASVEIRFSTVYAARQHEELGWQHLPGRRAKYLEGPLKDAIGDAQAAFALEMRAALRA